MGQYAIKETKEAMEFLLALHKGVRLSMEDGKVGFMDLPNLVKPMLKLSAALEGMKSIPAELGELDAAEVEEIKAMFKEQFDLEDDVLEAKIEEGLGALLQLGKFLGEVI